MNKFGGLNILVLIFALISMETSHAVEQKLNQVQSHLKIMQNKIAEINRTIQLKKQTHQSLEVSISKKTQQLQKTHAQKLALDKKLEQINMQIEQLNIQIHQSQENISIFRNMIYNHLQLHLQLSQKPYWQVVFSANNPFDFYQRMTLYQYLFHSEHQTLQSLKQSQNQLQKNQIQLSTKMQEWSALQKMLSTKELILLTDKNREHQKLQQVSQEIVQNTEQIHNLKKNEAQLKKLIQTLLQENQIHANRPFTIMRKRLNYPVQIAHPLILKSQNGIIFISPAQTQVHAVSTGKVVFSDWLNGYGYLVILDHGQGFMTLYGNNQEVLKHKGEYVRQGDVIAIVGKSGAFHQTGLYFEIRQKARVVSALNWFQKRAV